MPGKFICHKDFASLEPIPLFHKEFADAKNESNEEQYLNRHVLFRKSACLGKTEKAILNITADDYFKLYINGKYVLQGPPPAYPNRFYYIEADVSAFLREGENTFAVHTYYQGLVNRVWVSGDLRACFWCELSLDGEIVLQSDESWLCHNHTGYTSCGRIGYDTAFAERYDSSAREIGFERPDFDDGAWEHARVYLNADYRLEKSPIKPLCVYEVPPVLVERRGNTVFLDFGQERVGTLCADGHGKRGDTVCIRCAEELYEDGSARYDMRCNCRYAEEWVLSGKEDSLEQFDYKAFRYAEFVLPEGASLQNIRMRVRHYPFEKKAVYETQNEKLKRVLSLCEDTLHYGVQEAYLDCPTREKGQYLGDLAVSGRAHCILTQDTALLKKALLDFCQSTLICKGMMAVGTSAFMQEIADYSLLFPSIVLWVYKFDKDEAFLRYTLPYLQGMYEYFASYEDQDGLLDGVDEKWNLVDWPENLRDGYDFPLTKPIGKGAHNVLNAFWIGFLQALDEIATIVNEPQTGKTERAKQAFLGAFYDEKTGLFCDSKAKTHSAVHSNVLPLLFGIGTEDEALKRRLIDFVCEKRLTSMGVYMAYFALAALVKNGETEKAEELATDEGAWLNMLNEGATTTFEAWGKDQKWNTSLFHPWATGPLVVFAKETDVY